MLNIVIIGATSAIAHATAKNFAADGAHFFLVARSQEKLDIVCTDLKARGASAIDTYIMDANNLDQHQAMWDAAQEKLGQVDSLFIAHGILGDEEKAQTDVETMQYVLDTNFTSVAALLTTTAPYFEKQKRGNITVISSVAGDRGRPSNYVYGTAMAAKTAFLQGFRGRMAKSRVDVVTVKPGRVKSPMTAHLPSSPLLAEPDAVGKDIYNAMKKGKNTIYTPNYWAVIMGIIRLIPDAIFKRLSM